jgi:hypothetical protein
MTPQTAPTIRVCAVVREACKNMIQDGSHSVIAVNSTKQPVGAAVSSMQARAAGVLPLQGPDLQLRWLLWVW